MQKKNQTNNNNRATAHPHNLITQLFLQLNKLFGSGNRQVEA